MKNVNMSSLHNQSVARDISAHCSPSKVVPIVVGSVAGRHLVVERVRRRLSAPAVFQLNL